MLEPLWASNLQHGSGSPNQKADPGNCQRCEPSLGLQPYPQKVVRPPNPPQPSSQKVVGALGHCTAWKSHGSGWHPNGVDGQTGFHGSLHSGPCHPRWPMNIQANDVSTEFWAISGAVSPIPRICVFFWGCCWNSSRPNCFVKRYFTGFGQP